MVNYISLACLIFLVRTSSTMSKRCGKSKHPCLVHDLRGKVFWFSLLSIMFTVGFSHMAFIMLRLFLYIPLLLRVFIIKGCLIMSNVFFLHKLKLSYRGFFLHFVNMLYYIGHFLYIESSLHSRKKSHLVIMHNLLACC